MLGRKKRWQQRNNHSIWSCKSSVTMIRAISMDYGDGYLESMAIKVEASMKGLK